MTWLFIIACGIITLLVFFMFIILKKTVKVVNSQTKTYFVDKLQAYDSLIDEKEQKLSEIDELLKNKELGLKDEEKIVKKIRENNFAVTSTIGKGKDNNKAILFSMIPRKQIKNIIKIIKSIDTDALIISQNAFNIYGGYIN